MSDLRDQLRAYFDEFDEPIEADRLMRVEPTSTANGRYTPVVVLVTAALAVAIVIGGASFLLGGSDGSNVPAGNAVGRNEQQNASSNAATTTQPAATYPLRADPRDPDRPVIPMDVGHQLACLPLDAAGWSESEPLALLDEPWAVTLAANEHAAVVVGMGLDIGGVRNDAVVAYSSTDGTIWRRVDDFPYEGPVAETPPAVAGGEHGFVAVVNTPRRGEGLSRPIVLFSLEGVAWERVDGDALPASEVLWISDVYAGPAGFIIAGDTQPGVEAFVWASPDGRTWTASDWPYPAGELLSVVAADSGWIALGGPLSPGEGASSVWTSEDGVEWSEAPAAGTPPPKAVLGYFKPSPMALRDDTWVIASSFHDLGDPTVWVSEDRGATWAEHALAGEFASYQHDSWDVEFTPAGILVTGRHDLGADDMNLIHYSPDGKTWRHCGTSPLRTAGRLGSSAFTEVAMLGDTLLLMDNDTGVFHVWKDPTVEP